MKMLDKIKRMNAGAALQKKANGRKMNKRIYLGTEDELILFRRIIATLGIEVDYEVEDCDGEIEVVVKEVR